MPNSRSIRSWISLVLALAVFARSTHAIAQVKGSSQRSERHVPAGVSYRDKIDAELQDIKEALNEQRRLLEFAIKQAAESGIQRGDAEKRLQQQQADLEKTVSSMQSAVSNDIKEALKKVDPKAFAAMTLDTPQAQVDSAVEGLKSGLEDLQRIQRQAQDRLEQAMRDVTCPADESPAAILRDQCSPAILQAQLPMVGARLQGLAQASIQSGDWIPELLPMLPDGCIPKCLDTADIRGKREDARDASAANQQAQMMANTMVMMALQTGNPYIIAAAIVLALLLSSGGGSGSGEGSGEGQSSRTGTGRVRGKGGPEAGNSVNQAPAPPAGGGNQPVGGPVGSGAEKSPTGVTIMPGLGVKVFGTWPVLEFSVEGADPVEINLSEVHRRSDRAKIFPLVENRVHVLSAAPAANPPRITIETDNPDTPTRRDQFEIKRAENGQWLADPAIVQKPQS